MNKEEYKNLVKVTLDELNLSIKQKEMLAKLFNNIPIGESFSNNIYYINYSNRINKDGVIILTEKEKDDLFKTPHIFILVNIDDKVNVSNNNNCYIGGEIINNSENKLLYKYYFGKYSIMFNYNEGTLKLIESDRDYLIDYNYRYNFDPNNKCFINKQEYDMLTNNDIFSKYNITIILDRYAYKIVAIGFDLTKNYIYINNTAPLEVVNNNDGTYELVNTI